MRNSIRFLKVLMVVAVGFAMGLLSAARVSAQVDWLTERMDSTRSAVNLNETHLSKANVKNGSFGKLAFRRVDGNIYAQLLVVSQAKIANRATPMNVVIVATQHNSVYAFDGDDTSADTGDPVSDKFLWHTDKKVLGTPIPSDDVYARIGAQGCADITTEVGITSTPHIVLTKTATPKEGVIFVVAKSQVGTNPPLKYVYKLFALQLSDGTALGTGVTIAGQVTGPHGAIVFNPDIQLNRPGLLVDNNTLYVAFGGHCDKQNYRGWVFAYDVSNPAAPKKVDAMSTTFTDRVGNGNQGRGGIWMSGAGLTADGSGNVFFATGDGTYDVSKPTMPNIANSVAKVKVASGKIQLQDWFSPMNRQELQELDADLGSGGVVPVPGSHLMVAGGKEGRMYLLDGDDLGKGTTQSWHSLQVTNTPLPKVPAPANPDEEFFWNIHGAPVIWPLAGEMFVYVEGEEDFLKQYRLIPDAGAAQWKFESDAPFRTSKESAPLAAQPNNPTDKKRNRIVMPGGFITVSSNGSDVNSGIAWVTMPFATDANQFVTLGILRAFDASDVSTGQLWSTEESGVPADRLGMFAKFNPPTVANGKVYVATFQEERIDNGAHKVLVGGDQPALVIYGTK